MLNRLLTTLQLYISSNFRPLDLSLSWVARPTGLKTVLTMPLLSRPGRYSAPTAARAGAGGEEAADGSSSAEDGGAAKEGGVGVEAREVGRCGGCCCYCGGETSREARSMLSSLPPLLPPPSPSGGVLGVSG